MRRLLFVLLLATPPALQAQIYRVNRESEPSAWTSFSVGLLDIAGVIDTASKSEWQFGQGLQYRATLEKALRGGSGIGVIATYATIPLTYARTSLVGIPSTDPCQTSCDASANIYSVSGGFHAGGGMGLHQVFQLAVGATMWSNFREKNGGAPLPPTKMDSDLSLNVGYGLGYTLSPRMQASLVQEYGFIVHPGNGSGSNSRTVQERVTRFGVRYGIGTRKPGV